MSFYTLLHQLLDHFRAARDRLLSWVGYSVTIIAAAIASRDGGHSRCNPACWDGLKAGLPADVVWCGDVKWRLATPGGTGRPQ
jgi:hypothetical protein